MDSSDPRYDKKFIDIPGPAIPGPDSPIYRIFPVWRFQELLKFRRIALVSPQMWHDPFELTANGIALNQIIDGRPTCQIVGSDEPLPTILGQCWSATEESDALWRIYSRVVRHEEFERNIFPSEEGVRVRSTPRKLLKALAGGIKNAHCYVGAVKYMGEKDLQQKIRDTVCKHGVNFFSTPRNRVMLQLHKRTFFEHENEIRALAVWRPPIEQELKQISIEPSELLDQVTFDPRLSETDLRERESSAKDLGYKGEIKRSNIYTRVVLAIEVDEPPGDSLTAVASAPERQTS
jgi:hypothetical protein